MTSERRTKLMETQWEQGIKRQFDSRERPFFIDIPAECLGPENLNASTGPPTIKVTSDEVRDVFSDVVGEIHSMIEEQISKIAAKDKKSKVSVPRHEAHLKLFTDQKNSKSFWWEGLGDARTSTSAFEAVLHHWVSKSSSPRARSRM
jgi:hypothetical protein